MFKYLITLTFLATSFVADAMVSFVADGFDEANKTCRLLNITNHDEIQGTFTLPDTYNRGGVIYQITAVAHGTLNDIPNVECIVIPKSIVSIGSCNSLDYNAQLGNFLNCAKLQSISVQNGNPVFASSSEGFLMDKTKTVLLRCPSAVKTSSGSLSLPATVRILTEDSFADVTSVSSLQLPSAATVNSNAGLNKMPWLSEITCSGSMTNLKSSNGILTTQGGELICFPPRKMSGSYIIPNDIIKIGKWAFANTFYLSSVTMGNVVEIDDFAFYNSKLKKVSLPETLKEVGKYIFANSTALTNIDFNSRLQSLGAHFAADCKSLKSVTFPFWDKPLVLDNGAFMNCVALDDYPVSSATLFRDSVFYNTGFKNVVFEDFVVNDYTNDIVPGRDVFSACENLESIDMSAIDTETSGISYKIQSFFADNCPKLTEVTFPKSVIFLQNYAEQGKKPAFGLDSKLNKIVLGTFNNPRMAVFCFSGNRTAKPNVYVKTNESSSTSYCPVGTMWTGINGAKVAPIFYYESYMPLSENEYVMDNASYYVPGGSLDSYRGAINNGCYVAEFFKFVPTVVDNKLVLDLNVVFPEMVTIKNVRVNDKYWGDCDVAINTKIAPEDVRIVQVNYGVNGESFTTTYPKEFYLAGVDNVMADADRDDVSYYTLQGVRVDYPLSGGLYLVRKGNRVIKEYIR